jgi:nitrogen fixation protein NifU and related proteins
MVDVRDLYQELILEHARTPRNFGPLPEANRTAEGVNPLCGDKVIVELAIENELVREARFRGTGCAISMASASTMTEAVKGRPVADVLALFHAFHALVTGETREVKSELGKLAAFGGVAAYPMRVKCATLPWHTLAAALRGTLGDVTTE